MPSETSTGNEWSGAVAQADLVQYQPGAVVSRTLVKKPTGTVTAFAFDAGKGLSEHTAPFDITDCLEQKVDPVGALKGMRNLAGPQGAVLVVDERAGESFSTSKNDIDWMMYGWSIFCCLPIGMADKPSAETGAVMRPSTLRRYAEEAGFKNVQILPIDNYFFRFYRLL